MKRNKADIQCAVGLFCVVHLADVTALCEREVARTTEQLQYAWCLLVQQA